MAASHPLIGVVVPVFGHSRLVAEALVSVLDQAFEGSIVAAVVVDGDPSSETTLAVRSFAGAGDRPIYTLFRRNGRLPAARNAGIDLLLQLHPDLDAIYFLDADNRLSPHSLAGFWRTLSDNPTAAWAYPDIGFVGLTWGAGNIDFRQTAPAYDPLRHLMGNICEAGSMVRGEVFVSGLRFDETFNAGYEDWEFWLQCLDQGLVGAPATGTGFQYRRRSDSMLAEADRTSAAIKSRIVSKHHRLFSSASVLEKFRHGCAPYLLGTASGDWRLLGADGSWFRQGATILSDLIESAREHFHFTYLPRFVLLPVGNHDRQPTVSVEHTLSLLADPPTRLRTSLSLEPAAADEDDDDGFELVSMKAIGAQTDPRLDELADRIAQIDRPSSRRMDRRYAGPATFQIEQFVRERLAAEGSSELTNDVASTPIAVKGPANLPCLLIDLSERWANHPFRAVLEKRFAGLEKATLLAEPLAVGWTRYAGRMFPYYDRPLEFSGESADSAEIAMIVADTRALFYAGELKRLAKRVTFVTPHHMLARDYAAIEAAEHALSEIYCTPEAAIRLRSAGVPLRKIVELNQGAVG